jgi:predicted DNA-binding protein (MmcQ/YjbR family)
MTKDELINECLKMPDSYADYPFDPTTAVIKNVKGKMFAFLDFVNPEKIKKNCGQDAPVSNGDLFLNLKCSPALIEVLRAQYKAVLPGYYSNKNHWNTIVIDKDVPIEELRKMIKLSFDLVFGVKSKK